MIPSSTAVSASFALPPSGIASVSSTGQKSVSTPIRMTGIAWKRRGGMGKYSTTGAWERRRIELQGTKLLYYQTDAESRADGDRTISPMPSKDEAPAPGSTLFPLAEDSTHATEGVVVTRRTTWLEQAAAQWANAGGEDPTAPRGFIDLAKEKATVHAAFGHSGAPSPFAISIKARGETKWKLCFDYHKPQMEWLAALTDVVVQISVDVYNHNLLEAADPANQVDTASLLFHPPQLNQPPVDGENTHGHRLWTLEPYSIYSQRFESSGSDDSSEEDMEPDDVGEAVDDDEIEKNTAGTGQVRKTTLALDYAALQASAKETAARTWLVPENHLPYLAGVLNIALAIARASSTSMAGFWYTVVLANLGLFLCLVKEPDWRNVFSLLQTTTPHVSTGITKKGIAGVSPGRTSKLKKGHDEQLAAAPLNPGFIPVAGSSTVKLKNTTDLPVNSKNEVFAGWRTPPGDILQVRSHGYLATKQKVSSPGELYACAAVDIFGYGAPCEATRGQVRRRRTQDVAMS
jgi:Protein ENHANCED DISEASE RESISTANCE 2, C-terminal